MPWTLHPQTTVTAHSRQGSDPFSHFSHFGLLHSDGYGHRPGYCQVIRIPG